MAGTVQGIFGAETVEVPPTFSGNSETSPLGVRFTSREMNQKESKSWRDVGTFGACFDASMDLQGTLASGTRIVLM